MKVKVTKERISITEHTTINEGEYNVNTCYFEFSDVYSGLQTVAVFNDETVPIIHDRCIIPPLKSGNVFLGVYAYKTANEKLSLMYSPKPVAFYVNNGSFNENISQKTSITL